MTTNPKIGCLLIHGFGGNKEEIAPLANRLTESGYQVNCPSLAGHTGNRKDLRGVSFHDWILSAEKGLEELTTTCDYVYVIGFSMGGLIAINLALKHQLRGAVTLNTPIYYWDLKQIIVNTVNDVRQRKLEHIRYYLRSSASFPISALVHFRRLLHLTKPVIARVQCPLFVAQALEDDTVRKSSAAYIYERASSDRKSIQYYPKSGHLILWSEAADMVMEDVLKFLNSTAEGVTC